MRQHKDKVESFHLAHWDFMRNLDDSLDLLDHDIHEAKEVDSICTGSWCKAIENSIDELSNFLYSISEPRWLSTADSEEIHRLRAKVHDLYRKYRSVRGTVIH